MVRVVREEKLELGNLDPYTCEKLQGFMEDGVCRVILAELEDGSVILRKPK